MTTIVYKDGVDSSFCCLKICKFSYNNMLKFSKCIFEYQMTLRSEVIMSKFVYKNIKSIRFKLTGP